MYNNNLRKKVNKNSINYREYYKLYYNIIQNNTTILDEMHIINYILYAV